MTQEHPSCSDHWFINPFRISDLLAFDEETLQELLAAQRFGVTLRLLAQSCHCISKTIVQELASRLSQMQQKQLCLELRMPCTPQESEQAQRSLLDALFWELIYWNKPEWYEELTEGEGLHHSIFPSLEPLLQGRTILDVGAGSGRATFGCIGAQAACIHAVEPSLGLSNLLEHKIVLQHMQDRIIVHRNCFEDLPFANASIDYALACSAFTAQDGQGGEVGLAEMKRVTRPGGRVIIIWPRTQDHAWFYDHGFHYVSFAGAMQIRFRSMESALRCADVFYGKKPEVKEYLRMAQRPILPFSIVGLNPPRDYFWLPV